MSYVYTIGNSLTLPFSLQTGSSNLPQGSFPGGALPVVGFNPVNGGVRYVDQHPPRSYAMNWNLNIQHEISCNVTAMVGYVGSHTVRPIIWDGTASYEGLQSQLQLRTGRGFQVQAVYGYSKCLDDGSGAQLGDPFLNSLTSLQLFAKAQGQARSLRLRHQAQLLLE